MSKPDALSKADKHAFNVEMAQRAARHRQLMSEVVKAALAWRRLRARKERQALRTACDALEAFETGTN